MGDKRQRFGLVAAVHLFLLQNDRILLLRRFNTGYEDGNFSVPAGHLDGNEEVITAAIREAYEEVGVRIRPEAVEVVGVMHRRADDERVDFFVAVRQWAGEITNFEPHKCDLLEWYALRDLPPNVIPYVRQAISNYQSGQWFDSFGWEESQG